MVLYVFGVSQRNPWFLSIVSPVFPLRRGTENGPAACPFGPAGALQRMAAAEFGGSPCEGRRNSMCGQMATYDDSKMILVRFLYKNQ